MKKYGRNHNPCHYCYKSLSHFLPLFVCDQITSAEPMMLVIKKIIVNVSILFHFKRMLNEHQNIFQKNLF